ncbi:hypothetical protein BaRGS_00009355 [Batillaria attramentaria]|uniref:Uncharacterized protein n=1 Tax=Batillaria attramentaria TaxID=370345 RepID=A0ABD0LJ06_9CAEN
MQMSKYIWRTRYSRRLYFFGEVKSSKRPDDVDDRSLGFVAPYKCVRAYLPNLRAIIQHFRKFSSQDEASTSSHYLEEPDIDRRFPLPGRVGLACEAQPQLPQELEVPDDYVDPLITLPSQPAERHFGVLAHYLNQEEQFTMREFMPEEETPKPSDLLECVAYDCPMILRKDFADLFPDRNTTEGPFTVITLSQHTNNDMSMWSMDVETEREELLDTFMHGAMEICNCLQKNGFWSDFIDPSTGKPFRGPHTNAVFFETDERYRKLGFQIDDLGCCKVIRHPVWGTHAFVSCLFTTAPVDHPIISQLVKS